MTLGTLNRNFKFPATGAVDNLSTHLKSGNLQQRGKHKRNAMSDSAAIPVITVTQADSVTIQNGTQKNSKGRRKSDVPAQARPNLPKIKSVSPEAPPEVAPPKSSHSNNTRLLDTSPLFRPGLGVASSFSSASSRKKSISSEHSSDRDPFYYDRPQLAFLRRFSSPLNSRNFVTNFLRPRTLSGTSSRSAVSSALYPASSRSSSAYPSASQILGDYAPSAFRRRHSRILSASSNLSSVVEEAPLKQSVLSTDNRLRRSSFNKGHFKKSSGIERWLFGQSSAPSSPAHSRTSSAASRSHSEMSEGSAADPALLNAFLHPSGTSTILSHEPTAMLQPSNITVNQQTPAGGLSLFPTIRENPAAAGIRREMQASLARKNEEQRRLLESSRSSIHSSPPSSVFGSDNASLSSLMTRRTGGMHSQSSSLASSGIWPIDAPIRRRRDSFGNWSMSSGAEADADWLLNGAL